ncbi:MAG: hypothetical protein JXN65_01865 [Clostridia bacterium]|nr:hypothetical protein [Clostridia bacterium]
MRKFKLSPVYISLLTVVIFAAAIFAGMQTGWWITEGRGTPLAGSKGGGHGGESEEVTEEHIVNEIDEITEEEHETEGIAGSSTVQNALDMGITMEELEQVLEGAIEDTSVKIQDLVSERGLKFGVVKDALNALIDD